MPYKSVAQRKKMFALEAEGKVKAGTAEKWQKETKGPLPQKVSKSKPKSTDDLRKTYEKKFGKK